MATNIDGLQVLDATPLADGSLTTQLVDADGNVVATVTRAPDGVSQAAVFGADYDGNEWSRILGKVTSFLDSVAQNAQATSEEAQRIANAARGAVTGARIGYSGPTNWTPYVIGFGALILLFAVTSAQGSRR